MEKVVKVSSICPEGYELDKERSTIENLVFKLQMCYKSVAQELFKNNKTKYYINSRGCVEESKLQDCYWDLNTCTSVKQAKKLLAINQLLNVAKYLNGDWKPGQNYYKYTIIITRNNEVSIGATHLNSEIVYFKTEELAKEAIDILGEETIKLALSTDW